MSVFIDDVKIDRQYITQFHRYLPAILVLVGEAPETEGKKICDSLKELQGVDTVQIKDEYKGKYSGAYEITEMVFPPPELDKAPAMYRFNIKFKKR